MSLTRSSAPIPRHLLVLECIGTCLIIIGVIESFGPQLLMPGPLRFDGYGFVLVALGITLVLPLLGHLLRLSPAAIAEDHPGYR